MYDFEDGIDKIDAQGLAFNQLSFVYDSTWKYTWILANGARTVGLKNVTPDKVTTADFINLGSGSSSGSTGSTGAATSGSTASASAPTGSNGFVYGTAGADVIKIATGQDPVKWWDFQDGIDKIDAQGIAFNRLGFSYDSTWKYTWISDSNGDRILGLKYITPSQVTTADFINLGSGSSTGSSTSTGTTTSGSSSSASAPTGSNGFVYGTAGADVIKIATGQDPVKWWDFQDGIDKIDAQGIAFNRLGFSYDSTWKYTWISDSNGDRILGLKYITPSQVTTADFINLGSGSSTGSSTSSGGTVSSSSGDNSISARNNMLKIWQDDWAGKLARGDLDKSGYFDPVPGNNNWDSRNSGESNATSKNLVWTSDAADRPNMGKYAAMALTVNRGVEGGYNAFSNASSYFDTGYDKMSVAADFYFPTSYKMESLTQPGAPIDAKNMFGLYASAKGVGKPGGTLLQPSTSSQNATWVEFGFKQNAVFGNDGYGGNNLRFNIGTTDFNRTAVGLETKIDSKIAIPKGKWVRLEGYAQIDTNGHNGIARLYQDGQLIAELNNLDLGGARYGWKLHGFMGTWMWGGAGDKYVSAKTESFYIKNMRIYDDPPTGDEAVASADHHTTDVDSAKAAFGEAALHDKSDPDDATDSSLIVTADAQHGTPDYMSATAATEAAATAAKADATTDATTDAAQATTVAEEVAAVQTDATAAAAAEGQQHEAAAGSEEALQAALLAAEAAENAQAPAADDATAAGPAAETVAEATTATTSEGTLAQELVPTHDPAAFVHIA
ncbi:MAG: hypothetical protein P9C48_11900 [Defluviicoccus sp.]|nr:hypothetical protein [Defluviicoccus sp.]